MLTLTKIQSELKAPKNLTNKFGGYSYRSCEGILEAAKPILAKYDATLIISDDIFSSGDRVYVKATASFKCKEGEASVTAFARESASKKGMDESQITGSASSYARKYALNGLFLIEDSPDADATNDHGKNPAAKKTKTPSKDEDLF